MSASTRHAGARLWIARAQLVEMMAEADAKHPLETGGVLLGYEGETEEKGSGAEVSALVVTATVGPGPGAIHERHRFVPDHEFHRAAVARFYESSGRICRYLGDWHTHPGAAAYMSSADAHTLERIATSTQLSPKRRS
jgi:integrative and conjugative element protein (TIGR02256 family)